MQMKLLIENFRKFINEEEELTPRVVTVDFDDTIKMTEDGNPNPVVISKIKQFKDDGAKVYVVTSRLDRKDNRLEINDFVDENNITHDGIHLTDGKDKWYTVSKLGSDMHFDDDDEEHKAIQYHIDEFPEDKRNIKLMKVDWETGKVKEWKGELDESAEPNPWAICTKSVGREDKKKYEACVLKIKRQTGKE
jgi:hypothetical protein